MRITAMHEAPIGEVHYLNAGRDDQVAHESLEIMRGTVAGLPDGLDGVVVTSDLQGRERVGQKPGRLLGEVVVEKLVSLSTAGVLPPSSRLGVLLAGDFYCLPDLSRRGGHGDASPVWKLFGEHFRWVAGVLGNHDALAPDAGKGIKSNCHLLDGNVVNLDGHRIGGVGGIVGKPTKANRKDGLVFRTMLESVLLENVDVFITHEAPSCAGVVARGNDMLRDVFESRSRQCAEVGGRCPLVVCGHSHWPAPLAELPHGMQVIEC